MLALVVASTLLLCGGHEANAPPPVQQQVQQQMQIQKINQINELVRSLKTTVVEQERKNEQRSFAK